MCREIEDYKNSHDFSTYFDMDIIDDDAEKLLNTFKLNRDVIPIVTIAQKMGFDVYSAMLDKSNECLSGMIGISEELNKTYKNDKIILLNKNDSDEHRRFTLAHELAHYIYDYDENVHKNGYFNKYNTLEADTQIEQRANRFAVAFMMPKAIFTKILSQNRELGYGLERNIKSLSEYFNVPLTSVFFRIQELNDTRL